MTSLTNLGFTSKKLLSSKHSYKSHTHIPRKFTGICTIGNTIRYYKNGLLHCIDDAAIEDSDGNKFWYLNGERHRINGPAIESNGHKEWWVNGKLHRLNAPAIECVNGNKIWFINGEKHRTNGPAMECVDGTKYWCLHNKEYGKNNDFTIQSWIHFQRTLLF